jgi:hypothetical protein
MAGRFFDLGCCGWDSRAPESRKCGALPRRRHGLPPPFPCFYRLFKGRRVSVLTNGTRRIPANSALSALFRLLVGRGEERSIGERGYRRIGERNQRKRALRQQRPTAGRAVRLCSALLGFLGEKRPRIDTSPIPLDRGGEGEGDGFRRLPPLGAACRRLAPLGWEAGDKSSKLASTKHQGNTKLKAPSGSWFALVLRPPGMWPPLPRLSETPRKTA